MPLNFVLGLPILTAGCSSSASDQAVPLDSSASQSSAIPAEVSVASGVTECETKLLVDSEPESRQSNPTFGPNEENAETQTTLLLEVTTPTNSDAVEKTPVVSVQDLETRASQIVERFQAIIHERMIAFQSNNAPRVNGVFAKNFQSLQTLLDELVEITVEAPESSIAQEFMGEAAYQFAIYKDATSTRKNGSPGDTTAKITPGWKLRRDASVAFEKSLQLDSKRSLSHDRLARLRIEETGDLSDAVVLDHLLSSIRNDASSPLSIRQLLSVLSQTDVLSDSGQGEKINLVLRNVEGKARDEVLDVVAELGQQSQQEKAVLSEKTANPGHTTTAAIEALDLKIAELELIRMRYMPRQRRGFGGFLGELDRQAEDAGNLAARMAVDEDLSALLVRREQLISQENRNSEAGKEMTQQKIDRLERARMFLRATLNEPGE